MTRPFIFPAWAILILFVMALGCHRQSSLDQDIIQIKGVTWACNISTSFATYGIMSEDKGEDKLHLPVSDGDLLYLVSSDEEEFYFRYDVKEGDPLYFSADSLFPDLVFLQERVCQLEISDNQLTKRTIRELSLHPAMDVLTLYIHDTLTESMIRELERLESRVKGSGIILEHTIDDALFTSLLNLCRPSWLILESLPSNPDPNRGKFLEEVELLWINGDILGFSMKVQCCRNLESLIISEWEPAAGELLPISELKKLHTLTLAECGINALSSIELTKTLQRLHLLQCDTLTVLSGIEQITRLESLGLTGCDDLHSLEALDHLKHLKRIAFPASVTQSEFESLTKQHPSLEMIELIDCPGVTDLSPLKSLEDLKILILQSGERWPDHLENLDQLELIALIDHDWDEDQIAQLRRELPHTRIVPGSGICLGSGWILLLLPIILLSRYFHRKYTISHRSGK
jgi:hypothetical protein